MATRKLKGLGRGLEALLGPKDASGTGDARSVDAPHVLRLDQLQPGKYQPRTRMDEGALLELADSIKEQGLMQPILVRAVGPARYEIIAGERRFRAAGMAGLSEVPVLVRDVPDEAAAAMALIENIQREDLNPLEEAQGVDRLIREFGLTHELAAKAIGRSRPATSNLLRLLNLAKPVQEMLLAGDIEMGHARALLSVDGATQVQLGHQVVTKRLSVRETERLAVKFAADFALKPSARSHEKPRDVVRLEEELSDALATKVAIKAGAKGKGQLVIDFASFEQLDGIIGRWRTE